MLASFLASAAHRLVQAALQGSLCRARTHARGQGQLHALPNVEGLRSDAPDLLLRQRQLRAGSEAGVACELCCSGPGCERWGRRAPLAFARRSSTSSSAFASMASIRLWLRRTPLCGPGRRSTRVSFHARNAELGAAGAKLHASPLERPAHYLDARPPRRRKTRRARRCPSSSPERRRARGPSRVSRPAAAS